MSCRVWVLCVSAACGRVDFTAQPDAAGPAVLDAGSCQSWGPFSAPTELTGALQSPADDWCPTPTADERTVYFDSFRGGTNQFAIWRATRPDLASPFAAATLVTELDSAAKETTPTITADELDLVFTRFDSGVPGDLYEARRTNATGPFTDVKIIGEVSLAGSHEESPWLDATGLRLVFMRKAPLGELFETTRPARDQPFAAPRLLSEIDDPNAIDETPTLSDDGLELFFASYRPGGAGGADVWTARRTSVDAAFGPATHVDELATANDEYGLRLSRDGTTLYLNYDSVTLGGQDSQMSFATRSCLSR